MSASVETVRTLTGFTEPFSTTLLDDPTSFEMSPVKGGGFGVGFAMSGSPTRFLVSLDRKSVV